MTTCGFIAMSSARTARDWTAGKSIDERSRYPPHVQTPLVICLSCLRPLSNDKKSSTGSIETGVDHIEHFLNVVGRYPESTSDTSSK